MTTSAILSDNGVSSGSSGIKTSGGNDGTLVIQTTTSGGTATTAQTIGTDQVTTFAQAANLPNTFGFKNRIINGGMVIDQRNAGAASTSSATGYWIDRFFLNQSTTGKLIIQQNAGSVTPPAGFTKYLGVTSQSAYSVGSGDYYGVAQTIEGYNIADLGFGAAGASTVTLSFWVRSSLTGTFGGSLKSPSNNYSYPFTYTISSANTWEQKTITVTGPTAGTWASTTDGGLTVYFGLGVGTTYSGSANAWAATNYVSATGATSVVGTNGATFYITGVQLEKGTAATSFDFRSYGTELALCQRYYQKVAYFTWTNPSTASWNGSYCAWKVQMRVDPTVTTYSTVTGTSGKIRYQDGASDVTSYIPSPTVDGSSINVYNTSTGAGSNMFAVITAVAEL